MSWQQPRLSGHQMIAVGVTLIVAVMLIAGGAMGGAYLLALDALHNHSNLTIVQSCQHWGWIYRATARDAAPHLHAAVGRTLAQLGCGR